MQRDACRRRRAYLLALFAFAELSLLATGGAGQSYTLKDLQLGYEPCKRGSHLPAPTACSSAYFSCSSNGTWYERTCAGGAAFNRQTCGCDIEIRECTDRRLTGGQLKEYVDCCDLIYTMSKLVLGRTSGRISCGRAYPRASARSNSSRLSAGPSAAPTTVPPDADARPASDSSNRTETALPLPTLIGFGGLIVLLAAVPATIALCNQFSSKSCASRSVAALTGELSGSGRQASNDYCLPKVNVTHSPELPAAMETQAPSDSAANSSDAEHSSSALQTSTVRLTSKIQATYYSCAVVTNDTIDSQEDGDRLADSSATSNNLTTSNLRQLPEFNAPAVACCPSSPCYFVVEAAESVA